MLPNTQNPLVIVAWILAVFVGLPGFVAGIRLIFIVADSHKDLKTVVRYVHERRSADQAIEVTLTLVENDISAIQDKLDMQSHPWPERRTGPKDRRSA